MKKIIRFSFLFLISFLLIFTITGCKKEKKVDNSIPIILYYNDTKSTIYIEKDGKYEGLFEPTQEGYSFLGWYTAKDGGKKVSKNSLFSKIKCKKLYAKFLVNTYTLSFNTNGGNNMDPVYIEYDTPIDINSFTPYKTGYSFLGWFTEPELLYSFDLKTMPSHDMALFAKWKINTYSISYQTNCDEKIGTSYYDYGSSVSKPKDLSREDYIFDGWFMDSNYNTPYNLYNMPAYNITLYAKWTSLYHYAYFDTKGGTEIDPQYVKYNDKVERPDDPEKPGYGFIDWYTDEKYNDRYDFDSAFGLTDITIYAKYSTEIYTMTFLDEDGSPFVNSIDFSAPYESKINKPTDPEKTGYHLLGWTTEMGGEDLYTFSKMPLNGLTLYAKWEINSYDINIYDGDTVVYSESLYHGDIITNKLLSTDKVGHTFKGFFLDKEFEEAFSFGSSAVKDTNIYMKYDVNYYTMVLYWNNGKEYSTTVYQPYNTTVTQANPTMENMDFDGWYTTSDFVDGTRMFTEDEIIKIPAEVVNLYGRFVNKKYTLTYDSKGGTDVLENNIRVPWGDKLTEPPKPEKKDWQFWAWYTDSNYNSEPVDFDTFEMPTGDTTLYARWYIDNLDFIDQSEVIFVNSKDIATNPLTMELNNPYSTSWATVKDDNLDEEMLNVITVDPNPAISAKIVGITNTGDIVRLRAIQDRIKGEGPAQLKAYKKFAVYDTWINIGMQQPDVGDTLTYMVKYDPNFLFEGEIPFWCGGKDHTFGYTSDLVQSLLFDEFIKNDGKIKRVTIEIKSKEEIDLKGTPDKRTGQNTTTCPDTDGFTILKVENVNADGTYTQEYPEP